jgi:hypothetical protein
MEDECQNYFDIIQTRMEIFHSTFSSYNKINLNGFLGTFNNPNENSRLNQLEEDIESLLDLEKKIDYLIIDLENKFQSVISILVSINCHNHKKILNDIEILKNTSKRMISIYEQKKKENGEKIKKIKNSDFYLQKEDRQDLIKSNEYSDTSNQINIIDNYYSSAYFLQGEEENLQNDETLMHEYFYLQNALENEQKEFLIDRQNLQKINEIKNKIKDLTISIDKEIMKGKETLMEIDNNVNEYSENIDKTNDELRKAALLRNRNNSIKYPLYLGAIFGAAGSFVPGVGNAIGAVIGSGVGFALTKMEKRAIKKIEPHKYKD